MSARKRPTRVGDVLRSWLDDSGLRDRMARAHVVAEWADCVGPGIATVTSPLRVSGDTLIVAVRSSAWLAELRMMERRILEHVNQGRDRGRIQRIRFVMADTLEPEDRVTFDRTSPGNRRRPTG